MNALAGHKRKKAAPKTERLIDVLVQASVPTVAEAARAAGISDRGARKALATPWVKEELDRRIRERLSTHTYPKAAAVLHSLLTAESEYVQADAAKHVLAIHGVKPASDVTARSAAGIIINIIAPSDSANRAAQPIIMDAKNDNTKSNQ